MKKFKFTPEIILSLILIVVVLIISYELIKISKQEQSITGISDIEQETIKQNYKPTDYLALTKDELRQIVETDDLLHSSSYKSFEYKVYKKEPTRIIFKNIGDNGFKVIENTDLKYDHTLEVAEERFHYLAIECPDMSTFVPLTIDQILSDTDNAYIIFNYDNEDELSKDIVVKINMNAQLFRLLLYYTYDLPLYDKAQIRQIIQRDEFATDFDLNGYEYMQVQDNLLSGN